MALFANGRAATRSASEFPDLLHPNDAGYAKWAAALRPMFETLGLLPMAPRPTIRSGAGIREPLQRPRLSGWGYRPTTDADRESARRWQASDPNAAEWPFVTETKSFDGLTPARTAASGVPTAGSS